MLASWLQIVTYTTTGGKFKHNKKKTFKGHNTAGYACQVSRLSEPALACCCRTWLGLGAAAARCAGWKPRPRPLCPAGHPNAGQHVSRFQVRHVWRQRGQNVLLGVVAPVQGASCCRAASWRSLTPCAAAPCCPRGNRPQSLTGPFACVACRRSQVVRTIKAHDKVCMGVAWHPLKSSSVATCSWDGLIKYWD